MNTARRTVKAITTRALYGPGPSAPGVPAPPAGPYLGRGTDGPVHAGSEHHVLVLGPPRSGKTSRLVVPSVIGHRGPVVVTSTKPDVLYATIAWRSRLGTCWYWDPSGTTVTPAGATALRWSPVNDCDTWDQAVNRAHALATAGRPDRSPHEAHWIERAQALLAPLMHAAALCGADMAAVLSWLNKHELTLPKSLLEDADARRAADIIEGLAVTDSRELSGIFSTAAGILAAYRTDTALANTRDTNFDPSEFAASTDTVFLVSPSVTQAQMAPIVIALLDQIRSATYRWRPRPPMLFALDELANIAPLPDLPTTIAEGGSQGVIVLACLQDLSQARHRWGRAADGFLTLFSYKLLLPGIADQDTLRAVSTLAGEVDVAIESQSRTRSRGRGAAYSRGTTVSTRRQPRLPPDQIAALPPGTALLIDRYRLQRVAV